MTKPSFPYTGVYDYLSRHRLLETSPQTIKKAKETYWRLYQKHYQQWYRTQGKNIRIRLSCAEHLAMKKFTHKYSVSESDLVHMALKKLLSKNTPVLGAYRELLSSLRRLQSELLNRFRERYERESTFSENYRSVSNKFSELERLIRKHFE